MEIVPKEPDYGAPIQERPDAGRPDFGSDNRILLVLSAIAILLIIGGVSAVVASTFVGIEPPRNLSATAEGLNILLSWEPSPTPNIDGYNVYVNGESVNPTVVESTQYSYELKEDGNYTFWVTAVSGDRESGPSNKVDVSYVTPPRILSFRVGEGEYTNSRNVALHISALKSDECAFRNENGGWGWDRYSSMMQWVLSEGDGEKTVYAKCRNSESESGMTSDSIIYDGTPPAITLKPELNGIKVFVEDMTPTKCTVYSDNQVVYENEEVGSNGKSYAVTGYVLVKCVDAAGNGASVEYDAGTGEGKEGEKEKNETEEEENVIRITINNNDAYTTSQYVTLTLYATNAHLCRYKNENSAWSGWENYRTQRGWTLSDGFGMKTVYYECIDHSSKSIGTASDSIEYK
ncbi:MAG: fibronectin type III domain-containing protein, partial [Candidatus Micrarchaeia archaeon]